MQDNKNQDIKASAVLRREARREHFANMALGADCVMHYVQSLVDQMLWQRWWVRHQSIINIFQTKHDPSLKRSLPIWAVQARHAAKAQPWIIVAMPWLLGTAWQAMVTLQMGYERYRFARWVAGNKHLLVDMPRNDSVLLAWFVYAATNPSAMMHLGHASGRAWFALMVHDALSLSYAMRSVDASQQSCYQEELSALQALLDALASNSFRTESLDYATMWCDVACPHLHTASSIPDVFSMAPMSADLLRVDSPNAVPRMHVAVDGGVSQDVQAMNSESGQGGVSPLMSHGMFAHSHRARTRATRSNSYRADAEPVRDVGRYEDWRDQHVPIAKVQPADDALEKKADYDVFSRSTEDWYADPDVDTGPYFAVENQGKVHVYTAPMPNWSPFLRRQDEQSPYMTPFNPGPSLHFSGGVNQDLTKVCKEIRLVVRELKHPPECIHILHNNRHIELTQLYLYRQFLSQQEYAQLHELRTALNMANEVKAKAAPSFTPQ